jgi:uncharacterized membrane protein YciS (DUF1049 family)
VEDGRGIALPSALIAASVAARLAQLQWLHPLGWDEVEYFRATDWVRQGLVPYRDFWEHHTPLQWLLFAPVTALLDSPGVASVVAMRWAQLPLWMAAFALLAAWMRGAGIARNARWTAMGFALTSSLFMLPAVEYRVDVLGGVLLLLGLVLLQRSVECGGHAAAVRAPAWPAHSTLAGAAFALAAFANLRLGPVVVVAMLAALWHYGRRAAWAIAGAGAATAVGTLYFIATNSLAIAVRRVFVENMLADRLAENIPGIFLHRILAPFGVSLLDRSFYVSGIDPGGILLIVLGVAGLVRARGELRYLAVVNAANLLFIALMKYVFNYHLEIAALLIVPLVATQIRKGLVCALVVCAAMNISVALFRGKEADMQYQDRMMKAVHLATPPDGRVFDSAGWALHRKPAYEYWFLRAITFELESHGVFAAYVPSPPPDAIIADHDTRRWLVAHPQLLSWVRQNYVPHGRDLWLPRGRGAPIVEPLGATLDAETPPRWHLPHLGYNAAP